MVKKSPTPPALKRSKFGSFFGAHQKSIVMLTILGCMLGVILMSYFVLIHQSLRLDEAQSMWQTSHSIGDTLRVVAQDVHVPLYHVILHFWQVYFGHEVLTVRLLSLLFFVITIPLVYVLARQILAVWWALFATFLFSFMPFMNWYGNEARMYTLLALLATLSQFFFLRIIQHKKGWLGYSLTAMIGVYSHYFFSFNLATQGIFYLANRKKFASGTLKRFVMVALLVIVALLPWLLYFHSQGSGENTAPQLSSPSTIDFFNAFSQFLFGFQNNQVNTILVSCWPLLVLIAFFAIKRGQKLSLELSYMITAGFVPVILAYLLSFIVNPFFLSRYMISCVAPLIILLVWFISNYGRRLSLSASSLLVVALILASFQQIHSDSTPVKEDYRAVATAIAKQATPQDIIVLSAPFTVYPFAYYYSGNAQITTLPIWNRQATGAIPSFNPKTLPAEVRQLNANHTKVYLVLSQNQGYENEIKQYFLNNFKQVSRKTYSQDLSLYVFQVGYNTVPPLGAPETLINAN